MPRCGPLILLLASLALGCAGRAPAPEPYLTPLAWDARLPDRPGTLYLLGSIHVGSAQTRQLNPTIVQAWRYSDELVVEVDLDASSADGARAWGQRAYLPSGCHLADVLSPETWQLLSSHLEAHGLEMARFASLKPWAVVLQLARIEFEQAGFAAEQGVDRRFLNAAAGRKPVVALESYSLQLDLYDGFSLKVQEMMLRDLLQPSDPYETAALVDAWEHGDEQAFLDLLFPDSDRWQAYRERFFYQRNENMVRKLAELEHDGRTRFVVVGVGHMVGPRGIPALLAAQGWTVERIGVP